MLLITFFIFGKAFAEKKITYTIKNIDVKQKRVEIEVNLPYELIKNENIAPDFMFYKKHGIKSTEKKSLNKNEVFYIVDFSEMTDLSAYKFPMIYPIFSSKTCFLPAWSLLLIPKENKAEINIEIASNLKNAVYIASDKISTEDLLETFIIYNYKEFDFTVKKNKIKVFCPDQESLSHISKIVQNILKAHFNIFSEPFFDKYYLVFDPMLKGRKGVGFTAQTYHLMPQYLIPKTREQELSLIELTEHEICHWFIESSELFGTYMVEGLNTYVAQKILYSVGVIDKEDFDYYLSDMYKRMLNNPLGRTISVKETEKIWASTLDSRYGELVYTKWPLITYLLDQKTSILDIAKNMFTQKVSKGEMVSEKDFLKYLGKYSDYFEYLINAKDITGELKKANPQLFK